MEENKLLIQNEISNEEIKNLIYTIRGKQVMLDSDVARLFKYQTKDLNRNVRNNIEGFPEYYCFQLTNEEYNSLRCKIFTLKNILKVAKTNKFHDRFIVIDNKEMYHLGASIKDLGKKCFGVNKIEDMEIIKKIINI